MLCGFALPQVSGASGQGMDEWEAGQSIQAVIFIEREKKEAWEWRSTLVGVVVRCGHLEVTICCESVPVPLMLPIELHPVTGG